MATGDPFTEGEVCLLNDIRGKQYLVTLETGQTFQSDKGSIRHADIIGAPEGSTISTTNSASFVALRPRLADYVLRMKRGAAVMYPKDTGAIITWADIAPGCTVVEAGTGSGGLTLALARAVGPKGLVVSVERRDDHATHARRLIEAFSGRVPTNIDLRVGDVETEVQVDAPVEVAADTQLQLHDLDRRAARRLLDGRAAELVQPALDRDAAAAGSGGRGDQQDGQVSIPHSAPRRWGGCAGVQSRPRCAAVASTEVAFKKSIVI